MIAVSPFSSDISAKQAKCRFTIEWVQNVNGGLVFARLQLNLETMRNLTNIQSAISQEKRHSESVCLFICKAKAPGGFRYI